MSDALVSTDWLAGHLDDPQVRILEASIARSSYDEAHVPGALWIDWKRDLLQDPDERTGDVITAQAFAALMGRLGVSPRTTVVWYGDRNSSYAIRGFWTMVFYRHPAPVRVLDGGRERWLAERRPVATVVPSIDAVPYPAPTATNAAIRADLARVRAAVRDPRAVIVDVRSDDEFTGKNARAKRGGHIPGAAHVEWTDATAAPNVLRSRDELRRMYEAAGVTPDKEVIAHCQLGVRAAHTWFVLKHVLDYPHVRNYDGSWQEWGNREDTPIER